MLFSSTCLLISKTCEKGYRIVLILIALSYLFCIGGMYFPLFQLVWLLDLFALLFLIYNLKGLKPYEKVIYPLVIVIIASGVSASLLYLPFKYEIFYLRMIILLGCLIIYFTKRPNNAHIPGLFLLLMSYIILEIIAKFINNW